MKLLWNVCRATNDRLLVSMSVFSSLHIELKTKRYPLHDSARRCSPACLRLRVCFCSLLVRAFFIDGVRHAENDLVMRTEVVEILSDDQHRHRPMMIVGAIVGSSDAGRTGSAGDLLSRPGHLLVLQEQDQAKLAASSGPARGARQGLRRAAHLLPQPLQTLSQSGLR